MLIFIAVFQIYSSGKTQSLAFSRVILQHKNVTDTVPAGKVWKLESYATESEICGSGNPYMITVNGFQNYIATSGVDGNGRSFQATQTFPFWIPAGGILSVPQNGSCIEYVSIIEFTITP